MAAACTACHGAGRIGDLQAQCSTCVGTGVAPYVPPSFAKYGTTRVLCAKCGGSGRQVGAFGFSSLCDRCRGTGRKLPVYETCPACHGAGATESAIGEMLECASCKGDGALVHTA